MCRRTLIAAMLTAIVQTAGPGCADAKAADLGPWTQCFMDAAKTYGRDARLYYSITQVESSGCRNLVHVNANGTRDIGCMQINSSQFPFLQRFGITEDRLLKEPCLNIHVGAWILEQKVQQYGPTWEAVGAYNAACSKLKGAACVAARMRYIHKVVAAYTTQADAAASATRSQAVASAPAGVMTTPAAPQLRISGSE